VPVSTSTRLSRSSPISYRARGKSVCIYPVNIVADGEDPPVADRHRARSRTLQVAGE
jgi:hypothetical protein